MPLHAATACRGRLLRLSRPVNLCASTPGFLLRCPRPSESSLVPNLAVLTADRPILHSGVSNLFCGVRRGIVLRLLPSHDIFAPIKPLRLWCRTDSTSCHRDHAGHFILSGVIVDDKIGDLRKAAFECKQSNLTGGFVDAEIRARDTCKRRGRHASGSCDRTWTSRQAVWGDKLPELRGHHACGG